MGDDFREDCCAFDVPGHRPPGWEFLGAAAKRVGFVAVGVAPADTGMAAAQSGFEDWIARGRHGGLGYLERNLEARFDPRHKGIVPGATAVVSAALPYGDGAAAGGFWRFVASHARGRDYHGTMGAKLAVLALEISARFPGARLRTFVDTAPVAERAWALAAKVGSLGANGAILVPGVGPRVVLGEVVVANAPPPEGASVAAGALDACAGCDRCRRACPTGALVAPGIVDCRLCLSFHTIENGRGDIPAPIASRLSLVFGCDACTSVCPRVDASFGPSALEPPPHRGEPEIAPSSIATMHVAELSRLLAGTCLERTGPEAIRRNARAIVENRHLRIER